MDEDRSGAGLASDEEIFDQLRQYADALAARASSGPISVPDNEHEPRPRRRTPILAIAAAVAVLLGAAAWVGSRNNSDSIRSVSDEQTPTTADDKRVDEAIAATQLMPDPAQWVITEAYQPLTSPGRDSVGVWAWRLDGDVYLLVDGVGLDNLGPLNRAEVEVGDGRLMMGWLDGDHRLGLQGYGVDEPTLRSVAVAITPTDLGWELPGAEVLVAEAGGESGPVESVQVGYSPLTSEGTADLSRVVTGIRRQGTEADLYRVLFEASSVGQVAETTVGGEPGFVMTGSFGSYGLVFSDGWVSSWQTLTPDIDLADVMGSIRAVTAAEWDKAVAGADDVVAQAVAAIVAQLDSDVDLADPANDPDLPRYVLPEPWTFGRVTDMGLWSAEERAQREALSAAHVPPGGFTELIWTQGFVPSNAQADQVGSLPFVLPALLVQVYRRETDEPLDLEGAEVEPFSFIGLDGYFQRLQMFDRTSESGSRTEIRIAAAQGPLVVSIEAPFSNEDDIRRFAQSLSIPGDDVSRGVESADSDFELLIELPGEAGNGADFYSRWSAAYGTGGGNDETQASLSVESMTFEQLQLQLMRLRSWDDADYKPVAGGRYLAHQYERSQTVIVDDNGISVIREGPGVIKGTSLLRYDPDDQILVGLNLDDDLDATIALMEQLTEVDIETWRELVAPYNAKPLQPR